MLTWIVAGLLLWLWSWKAAVCVIGAAFVAEYAWRLRLNAKIRRTRALTNQLIERTNALAIELDASIDAEYRKEFANKYP